MSLTVHFSWFRLAALSTFYVFACLRLVLVDSVSPVVKTAAGSLQGVVEDGVAGFLGVPFAEPPARFAPSVVAQPWTGVRAALQPSVPCFQNTKSESSEDCLYLNAFAPVGHLDGDSPPAPVMVYFHGGSFLSGSAFAAWNLTRLTGSIVVSPQYRLQVFGFYSPDVTPSNFGLGDQRLALRWVQENAEVFGGDPSRVLIFGGSAGGASVAAHLVIPDSFGLYSSAALESPGGHQGWMSPRWKGDEYRPDDDFLSMSSNMAYSAELSDLVGCANSSDLICLRALPADALFAASSKLRFAPALSVEGEFPLSLISSGRWNQVPVIIGGVSCESCKIAGHRLGPMDSEVTKDDFRLALIQEGFAGTADGSPGPDMLMEWYAQRIVDEGLWRTYARILSDAGHACSAALHAEALAQGAGADVGVWRFFFDFVAEGAEYPGATHGAESPWIFNAYQASSPAELNLEQTMGRWWASLAAHGDPNVGVPSAPEWPTYRAGGDGVMFLDTDIRVESSSETVRSECEHWKPFLGFPEGVVTVV